MTTKVLRYNKEGLERIADTVEKDIGDLVVTFTPIYLDWINKKLNEYRKSNTEHDSITCMFNLHTHSMINIGLNTTYNLTKPVTMEGKMQVLDALKKGFDESIELLRETIQNEK